jgi:FKBP-type peptidyl-prolyl cis-trans isomerase SlyD
MSTEQLTVADGVVVSMDYTLSLDDGEVIDSTDGQSPLEFLQGVGEIIPGLEQALYGMTVDDKKEVVVEAADAYGEYDPEAIDEVERNIFPREIKLEPGLEVVLTDEDTGEEMMAFVAEIHRNTVVLDFNHPLAGETLHFKVKVTGLRPATAEELDHGHSHGEDDHY